MRGNERREIKGKVSSHLLTPAAASPVSMLCRHFLLSNRFAQANIQLCRLVCVLFCRAAIFTARCVCLSLSFSPLSHYLSLFSSFDSVEGVANNAESVVRLFYSQHPFTGKNQRKNTHTQRDRVASSEKNIADTKRRSK